AKASTLVLSEHARVDGEISVTHLVLNGTVTGPIEASEYLELQSKAKVTGDVKYKTLEIQLGAIVEGKLVHISESSEKVVSLKLSGTESK
ncbi:MAG: polymer-forming cytoskeletal protein, partial [Sideroxyarcus sp.]|nr:polymer-forming cytoskeletal protein [Sideroxyarcus sp.]